MTALTILVALGGTINATELAIVRARRFHQEVLTERLAEVEDGQEVVRNGLRIRRPASSRQPARPPVGSAT